MFRRRSLLVLLWCLFLAARCITAKPTEGDVAASVKKDSIAIAFLSDRDTIHRSTDSGIAPAASTAGKSWRRRRVKVAEPQEGVEFETDITDWLSEKDEVYTGARGTLIEDAEAAKEPAKPQPKEPVAFNLGNIKGKFQLKIKPETFVGRNINLLNNHVDPDIIYYTRNTFDVSGDFVYGLDQCKREVMELFFTLRTKATWGNLDSIAQTADADIRLADASIGTHSHSFTRQVPWIREVWLKVNLGEMFHLPWCPPQYFTVGAFPFELGRGIALGSAYAVGPGVLGFYTDNKIDQFAYGARLGGDLVTKVLAYDLYAGILENKTDSFTNTSAKVRGQEYGHRTDPARGPGRVNYVIATKLKWIPVSQDGILFSLEPYGLYNNAPEQKIEFVADAKTKLCTLGFAGEMAFGDFELGFDTAYNLGTQYVRGWDRNKVDIENRGSLTFINTQVTAVSTPVTGAANLYPVGSKMVSENFTSAGKSVTAAVNAVPQTSASNGQQFSVNVTDSSGTPQTWVLQNSTNRFIDPYKNYLRGKMAVADMAYWLYKRDLKIAMTAGIATGGENPNRDLDTPGDTRGVSGEFDGFIPLQEIYNGQRVQSVFLLGGAGRAPRPLTTPSSVADLSETVASTVSGFSDLVFIGMSLYWQPKASCIPFKIFPNILFYWEDAPTLKFDAHAVPPRSVPNKFARSYLGCEINNFFDIELAKDFKLFLIGSVFIPGGHYTDIKGKPLSAEQKRMLENAALNGVDVDTLPLLSNDIAYTMNIGFEARF